MSTAANGAEELERVREVRPTVIVLGLLMPVMDGQKFLLQRAGVPALNEVPVVVLTAQTDKAAAVVNDAVAVLAKPVHFGRLFGLIRQACDRPFSAKQAVSS